jgi:hypothetical protein
VHLLRFVTRRVFNRTLPAERKEILQSPPPTTSRRSLLTAVALAALIAMVSVAIVGDATRVMSLDTKVSDKWEPEISPMGAIARGDEPYPDVSQLNPGAGPETAPQAPLGLQGIDRLVHSPTATDFQSETSIAKNGNQVVVGYNDIRGFALPTTSVSGYSYSADGGLTWTDGGQLPTFNQPFEGVFGDPDVKTWTDGGGQRYFFYSSLYTNAGGNSSLCLHVSTDGGATWSTPREVTTATSASDFPDKEFMDVDPETGRIFISWTNFGAGTTMRVTYSDDQGLTWNGPTVFASSGQGSIPRAMGNGSPNVYIAWLSSGTIQFVRSTDNGVTWSAPTAIVSGLGTPLNPFGSDRIHGFPSMAIDHTTGNVYVVYAARNLAPDFSEIYFIRSTDGGLTFSNPITINALPGSDRAQYFPWVSVNEDDGRIDAIWYDQILGTGTSDITDVFHTHSYDGGLTWVCPTPLTDTRFHAEYGNTTSQPNMGDYNQCVSDGNLYTSFAKTGAASYLTSAPDTYVDISDPTTLAAPIALVGFSLNDVGCASTNGYAEPGEVIDLNIVVKNYSNCANPITNIVGSLSSPTPGINILNGIQPFMNLGGAGTTASNPTPFIFGIPTGFNCGDPITLILAVTSSAGTSLVPLHIITGVPTVTATVLSQNFDGVVAPALPPNWISLNLSGTLNPWVTSTLFSASAPNALYCANVPTTSLNTMLGPALVVPASCDLLDVTFDVTHNIEDDPTGAPPSRKAWDGALMRVRVNGATLVLAGSFAQLFQPFYPWQMNRQSSATQPFQDLSCWSSDVTPNFSQVHMQFPGLGGTTFEMIFDMSTDNSVGTSSGMFIDNVVVRSIEYQCECQPVPVFIQAFEAIPQERGIALSWDITTDEAVTGFKIARREEGDGRETIVSGVGLIAPDLREYVDADVQPGRAYEYALVVIDGDGSEVRSQRVTVRSSTVRLALNQNHPNPFNPSTAIEFSIPERSHVTLEVYDAQGKRVVTLLNGVRNGGTHNVTWDGKNAER